MRLTCLGDTQKDSAHDETLVSGDGSGAARDDAPADHDPAQVSADGAHAARGVGVAYLAIHLDGVNIFILKAQRRLAHSSDLAT